MKTKTYLFVTVFLSVILLFVAGCQKNPGPTPIPAKPVITISGVVTSALPYGDSTNFSWVVTGKSVYASLNGKEVSLSGAYNTGRLFADTSYKLSATNDGGTTSAIINLKVGDWTTSTYGKVSHSYWVFDSLGYNTYPGNSTVFTMYTDQEMDPAYFTDQYYYFPTGMYVMKNKNTGRTIALDQWRLLPNDTIVIANVEKYGIKILTKTKMVLVDPIWESYDSNGNGVANAQRRAWLKWVYKRDSK